MDCFNAARKRRVEFAYFDAGIVLSRDAGIVPSGDAAVWKGNPVAAASRLDACWEYVSNHASA